MRIGLTTRGDIRQIMAAEYLAGEKAVTTAMRLAAVAVKTGWRAQVTGAGLGTKLANSIRAETYPKGTDSMNAASLIWTKAPKLIGAHEAGPLIRSKDGFWLAIPTKAAGIGARGRKLTPNDWEIRNGRNLQFIYRKGRTALLIDNGTARFRSRSDPISFRESKRRGLTALQKRSVVIFTLVPQVKLAKRLNLDAAPQRVVAGLSSNIVANWK